MRVHNSQAYRKMDVTRERINCILVLREILLSLQPGFSLVNRNILMLKKIYLYRGGGRGWGLIGRVSEN